MSSKVDLQVLLSIPRSLAERARSVSCVFELRNVNTL